MTSEVKDRQSGNDAPGLNNISNSSMKQEATVGVYSNTRFTYIRRPVDRLWAACRLSHWRPTLPAGSNVVWRLDDRCHFAIFFFTIPSVIMFYFLFKLFSLSFILLLSCCFYLVFKFIFLLYFFYLLSTPRIAPSHRVIIHSIVNTRGFYYIEFQSILDYRIHICIQFILSLWFGGFYLHSFIFFFFKFTVVVNLIMLLV